MSLLAMSAVWECSALTSSQKLVSLYIADKVCEEHHYSFFGSKSRCIEKTRLKRDTVFKVFKELEDLGLITKIGQREDGIIEYRFNIHQFNNPYLMEKGSAKNGMGVVPKTARGGSAKNGTQTEVYITQENIPPIVPQGGTSDVNEHNSVIPQDYNCNPTGLSEGEDTIYINIQDNIPPIVPQRGTSDVDVASSENDVEINTEIVEHSPAVKPENDAKSEFDRFWEIYPKKTDKQYAFKCWKRKKTHKHIDVVLEDLNARLKGEWKDKDKTYIKNASTYINRESWRDIFEQRNNITEIKTEKQKIKEQLELLKKQRGKK
jgi:hypothetical protein